MTKRQRAAAENNWRIRQIRGAIAQVSNIMRDDKLPWDVYASAKVAQFELNRLLEELRKIRHDTVS